MNLKQMTDIAISKTIPRDYGITETISSYKLELAEKTYRVEVDAKLLHTLNLYEEKENFGGHPAKTLWEKLNDLGLYKISYDGLHYSVIMFTVDANDDTSKLHKEISNVIESQINAAAMWLNNDSNIRV